MLVDCGIAIGLLLWLELEEEWAIDMPHSCDCSGEGHLLVLPGLLEGVEAELLGHDVELELLLLVLDSRQLGVPVVDLLLRTAHFLDVALEERGVADPLVLFAGAGLLEYGQQFQQAVQPHLGTSEYLQQVLLTFVRVGHEILHVLGVEFGTGNTSINIHVRAELIVCDLRINARRIGRR